MAESIDNVSVVIPVFDDDIELFRLIADLRNFDFGEIIVVDGQGGSQFVTNGSNERLLRTDKGRGCQLAAGSKSAQFDWIWMLHADCRLKQDVVGSLNKVLKEPAWGRFDVNIDGGSTFLRVVAWFMNVRSALTAICTGDQGIFVHKQLLQRVGGIPSIPLMEDIELSKRLKRNSSPIRLSSKLTISNRKWQEEGVGRTILKMWICRILYWFGVRPVTIESIYYRAS